MSTNIRYITDKKQLPAVFDFLNGTTKIAIDTETNTLDPRNGNLLLVQLGNQFIQFVLDVYCLDTSIKTVLNFINEKKITVVAHNAKFDYVMIKHHLQVELDLWEDTMIGEQLLNRGKSKTQYSLEDLLKKYLNVSLNKTIQKEFVNHVFGKPFSEKEITYAAEDVEYLLQLVNKINTLLDTREMTSLAKLEYRTIMATGDLEYNGIFINKDSWLSLRTLAEKEAETWRITLNTYFKDLLPADLFGDLGINYNSPKQITPLLEKTCKMKIKSTADAVLGAYRDNYPVINALLEYRKAVKKVTTYGLKFLEDHVNPKTNRIHSTFMQIGADTGRYASSNPNMNNIPREQVYRTPFQAQFKDYKIISADFSQQELRLLAQLSKEPKFLKALEKDLDLHCFSASLIYEIPYSDFINPKTNKPWKSGISEHGDRMAKLRNYTKAINFGIIYGIGQNKLAKNLNITKEEANALLKKYFIAFPKIKSLLDTLCDDATINRFAVSPLDGRRRDLSEFDWDNNKQVSHALNIAKNLPFQGCGASTTKLALVKIRAQIKELGLNAKIVNVIHDEILVEAHESVAEQMAEIVRIKMIEAFDYYAPAAKMTVDTIIDNHWVH